MTIFVEAAKTVNSVTAVRDVIQVTVGHGLSADAVVESTALSLSTTASDNRSACDSKAASNSVIISTNLVACESRATSLSVVVSANLAACESRDASQSELLSTLDSKLASHIGA